MTNWERWIKRYVWDDERTPYLVAPERMTKRQADYEVFAYAVFICCLFTIVSMAVAPSPMMAMYSFSVVSAAIVLGFTKHIATATYTATTPIAAALYLALDGFPDQLGMLDHVVLITIILLWAGYSFRIISIARAYDRMLDS